MTVGITGAGGQLGTSMLRHLLARVPPSEIVAITREPRKLDNFAGQGVRVRGGDFNAPAGLAGAFAGIDRLLIIPTADLVPGVRPRQHTAAIDAAVASGVRHIIYVSTIGARPGASDGILETHFTTEQALIASGAAWTLVRMGPYADSLIDGTKKGLASGIYTARIGAPAAYVVRDDLGAASAAILATSGHEGITYYGTGPVSMTQAQIADALARIAGTPIAFSTLSREQHHAGLAAAGLPPALVDVLVRFQQAS
jgi:NAD(P)H dehydrogenase (quinone)